MRDASKGLLRVIKPASKDLGDFTVRRALPAASQRHIGPFVFFDHLGPVNFAPGSGINVRPHPHIGLATVTYLFAGEIRHRDSLGIDQVIRPGAVNWMTAGRGVVHSERTPENRKSTGSQLHGIQAWVALPIDLEETEPSFVHYDADAIPQIERPGLCMRLIAGRAFGEVSPVKTASETVYIEVDVEAGTQLALPDNAEELGVYVVEGTLEAGGQRIGAGNLAVLPGGLMNPPRAIESGKCILFGGQRLAGDRIVWWNFVSSSRKRIEQAKRDWREGRFEPVPNDPEFIPLPAS